MNKIELKNRAELLVSRLNEMGFTKNGKKMEVDQAFELVAAEEGFRNQHVLRSKLEPVNGIAAAATIFAQGAAAAGYPLAQPVSVQGFLIPRALDEDFAKALLVQHTVDNSDYAIAMEAWELIVEEAAKRAGRDAVSQDSEHAAVRAWRGLVQEQGWNDSSKVSHLESFLYNSYLMGEFVKFVKMAAALENETEETEPVPVLDAVPAMSPELVKGLQELGIEVKYSDLKRPFWERDGVGSCDFDTEAQAWADALISRDKLLMATALMDIFNEAKDQRVYSREDLTGERFASVVDAVSRHDEDNEERAFFDADCLKMANALKEIVNASEGDDPYGATAILGGIFQVEMATAASCKALAEGVNLSFSAAVVSLSDESRKVLAEQAFENYDFGDSVVGVSGWEWTSGISIFRRPVFLATAGADSRKVIFKVVVTSTGVEASVVGD